MPCTGHLRTSPDMSARHHDLAEHTGRSRGLHISVAFVVNHVVILAVGQCRADDGQVRVRQVFRCRRRVRGEDQRMADLGGMADKAKDAAQDHPEKVDQAKDKAKDAFGGKDGDQK